VACSLSMLGSCTANVKLPRNILPRNKYRKLLRGLARIKAVSLDIGCSAALYSATKQAPAIAVVQRLNQCIDEELFRWKGRTIEYAA